MIGRVDGSSDRRDVVDGTGSRIDLDHENRLDLRQPILPKPRLERCGVDGTAPATRQRLDLETEHRRHVTPGSRKEAIFQHEDLVAPGEHVDQRGFPGAVAIGGVDVDPPLTAEYLAEVLKAAGRYVHKRARIDVDRRSMHGIEDFVGHCGGARNAEEFAATCQGHRSGLPTTIVRRLRRSFSSPQAAASLGPYGS